MSTFSIEIENLFVRFGDHYALKEISLKIPANSFVAIVGPNGAGKSTFLKTLLGLLKPASGTIRICSRDPKKLPASWIGYVPQLKSMDRSFPAQSIELVLTGLHNRWPWHNSKSERKIALKAMEQVGAAHLANRPIARLSGGEIQRVYLARSIVRNPKVVMLDEPATGIDAVGEADVYRLLEEYQKESGATVLMITHDWHAATHHANYVLLLNTVQISFGLPNIALSEDHLRRAFGHIGHEHTLKFLVNKNV